MELSQLFVVVMKNVREFVQPALDAVAKRMDESLADLRSEFGEKIARIPAGKDGRDGIDGKNGQDGNPGADGKDGAAGRDGVDGANGKDGRDGVDGKDGKDGQNGKDGSAGIDGKDGADGKPGDRGADGAAGVDGKSVTIEDLVPVLESMQTKWALDFERRAQELFQRAIERMPAPKDGADGLGFDDLSLERKDFRHYVLRFKRGDQVKEFDLHLPMLVYRGVYKRGENYEMGDLCTWGGHMYHRDEPQGERQIDPDKDGSGWTQCVKRGNDGSSAYASAVKHGFVGSERDWVESIGKPAKTPTVKV